MTRLTPLLLFALARAWGGDVIGVNFASRALVKASPAVAAWTPAFAALFSGAPASSWPGGLRTLAALDWRSPANAAQFEPLARELARAGLSPEQFAAVPAHQRADAAARAFAAAVQVQGVLLDPVLERVERALEAGPEQTAQATVELLRAGEAAGVYLDDARAERARRLYRSAVALQTDRSVRRALVRLGRDLAALTADDPIGAALARERGEHGHTQKAQARLLRFDPSKRRPPAPPKIALRPGQDPRAVLSGLMHGLAPADASKLGFSAPRDDFFARYPSALGAARLAAREAGLSGEQVRFLRARTPLKAREDWAFTFLVTDHRKARNGTALTVRFAPGAAGGAPRPVVAKVADERLAEGAAALHLEPGSLAIGVKFSAAQARRFLGERVPDAQVGVSVVAELVEIAETGETDVWYRFVGAGGEFGRVNARTGRTEGPPKPRAPAPAARGWLAWLKSLVGL